MEIPRHRHTTTGRARGMEDSLQRRVGSSSQAQSIRPGRAPSRPQGYQKPLGIRPETRWSQESPLSSERLLTIEGMDYDAVFSPVVRFETVRLIFAMAALGGWVLKGLDVRNAYLYGELDEEIYMEQQEEFVAPGKKTHD